MQQLKTLRRSTHDFSGSKITGCKKVAQTDGYDGHSLRAYSYFPEEFPDIDPNSVESINSIEEFYKSFRQDSKPITFALTYKGTWLTLHKNLGYPIDKAKLYEERYHNLYSVSDEWVASHIEQATHTGYVTVAFGLRVRTPILHNCMLGTRQTPFQAEKEARSAGNALGQAWGLLNNRAHTAFMKSVRKHPDYRMLVRPMMHIHDAQYFLIKDKPDTLHWVNKHLTKECSWQDDPLIYHPQVKLGGDLGVFFPDWGNEIKLPNKASVNQLQEVLETGIDKYYNPEPK